MYFKLYGGIFLTYSPLNLYVTNSVLSTDYLMKGFSVDADCTMMSTNALYGEIVFNNYTQLGNSYLSPIPIVINTLNNMTFNNKIFKSFIKPSDPYKF